LPQLGNFLDRFRPAGAPGAASQAGVPVDRAAELAAELGPVLARLAGTDAECARIVAEAERSASQIASDARERAAAITAGGRARAQAARSEAAAEVLAAARAEAAVAARVAAARVRDRPRPTDEQVSELVRAAVQLVMAMPAMPGRAVGPSGGGNAR